MAKRQPHHDKRVRRGALNARVHAAAQGRGLNAHEPLLCGLTTLCPAFLRDGDVLTVTKPDRLACSRSS
jgi:hypothetical protein